MNVSSVMSCTPRRNLFIEYANSFMGMNEEPVPVEKTSKSEPETKIDKVKGLETLTIFPKQVIDGKMVITA